MITGRYLLQALTALGLFSTITLQARAEFSFDDYENTLNLAFDNNEAAIKSGYELTFEQTNDSPHFFYYEYDGETITPKGYNITLDIASGADITGTRQVVTSDGISIAGNYYISSLGGATGGALYNTGDGGDASNPSGTRGTITQLAGDFFGTGIRYYNAGNCGGAAIANDGVIEVILGDFTQNFVHNYNGENVYGGAIYNGVKLNNATNYIGDIKGNFIRNSVQSLSSYAAGGGAIGNWRSINTITGAFVGNYTYSVYDTNDGGAFGGAIFNGSGIINIINADFIGNKNTAGSTSSGGAIANFALINEISGVFNGNFSTSNYLQAFGGAIHNQKTIGSIKGSFINNYATSNIAYGGAIANGNLVQIVQFEANVNGWNNVNEANPAPSIPPADPSLGISIASIDGEFIGNYARGGSSVASGGAIYNAAAIGVISGNFIDNYATSQNQLALGGAVYTSRDLNFLADNREMKFSGNYTEDLRGKICSGIYVHTATAVELNFDLKNGGTIIFDDNISGGERSARVISYANQYDINITGDNEADEGASSSKMYVDNDIINAGNISIKDAELVLGKGDYGTGAIKAAPEDTLDPVTSLSLDNAVFHIGNGYTETVRLSSYAATNNSYLHLDVDPDAMTADILDIKGNVEGQTKLVIHATSNTDIRGEGEIPFAYSVDDATGNADSFRVFRVYTSPYMYDVAYHESGLDKEWGLVMNDTENKNPDPDPAPGPGPNPPGPVTPEVIAYMGLHAAAFEQTRSLVRNVSNHLAMGKVYVPRVCGFQEEKYQSNRLYNAWVRPTYYNSDIKKPLRIDASIQGIDGGFDSQLNANHKTGLFLSYRNGNYDLDGRSDRLVSTVKSKIDMDSYLAGMYYRYDKNCFWTFLTAYAGFHDAKFKSYDGVNSSTDGAQFGVAAEAGYLVPLSSDGSWTLEPGFAVSYSQVDFDAVHDAYGKSAYYDIIRQVELELSMKVEKSISTQDHGKAKVYFKPAMVRPFTSGDNVTITHLGRISTYHDALMGRAEAGGKYNLTDRTYVYGTVDYTFGNKYNAFSANIGINFSFGN